MHPVCVNTLLASPYCKKIFDKQSDVCLKHSENICRDVGDLVGLGLVVDVDADEVPRYVRPDRRLVLVLEFSMVSLFFSQHV